MASQYSPKSKINCTKLKNNNISIWWFLSVWPPIIPHETTTMAAVPILVYRKKPEYNPNSQNVKLWEPGQRFCPKAWQYKKFLPVQFFPMVNQHIFNYWFHFVWTSFELLFLNYWLFHVPPIYHTYHSSRYLFDEISHPASSWQITWKK